MNSVLINGWKVNNLHELCSNQKVIKAALYLSKRPLTTKTIYIQDEHTLVLPGGRDMDLNTPDGVVNSADGKSKYKVRLNNKDLIVNSDLIIDYALPNIYNIRNSQYGGVISPKLAYAPSIPELDYNSNQIDRSLEVVTNFISSSQHRRIAILNNMRNEGINVQNITGIYGEKEINKLYAKTKILVNVHQTDHHHTVEEFRILPAIANGCIVISEWSPLSWLIPYAPFVLWSNYKEIPRTVKYATQNYQRIYKQIFADNNVNLFLSWYKMQALRILISKLNLVASKIN